jgi:hypothetical protein
MCHPVRHVSQPLDAPVRAVYPTLPFYYPFSWGHCCRFIWIRLTAGYFRRLLSLSDRARKLDGLDGEAFVAIIRTHSDGGESSSTK